MSKREKIKDLERQLDDYRGLYHKAREENRDLRDQVEWYKQHRLVDPPMSIETVEDGDKVRVKVCWGNQLIVERWAAKAAGSVQFTVAVLREAKTIRDARSSTFIQETPNE